MIGPSWSTHVSGIVYSANDAHGVGVSNGAAVLKPRILADIKGYILL
jgi:hypothetical protein